MTGYMVRQRILALMAEQHLLPPQMAGRLNWPLEYVTGRILGGRGPLNATELGKIAGLLDVPVDELVEGAWFGCPACGAIGPQVVHFDGCTGVVEELLPAVPR